jgi:phage FluMu protein Com
MRKVKLKSFPLLCENCKKSFMVMSSEFKDGNDIKCPYCEKVNFTFHQNIKEDIHKLLRKHLSH